MGNRYGYGRSQADYLDREYIPDHGPAQTGGGDGDTTEAAVIADIIDQAKVLVDADLGAPMATTMLGHLLAGEDGATYPTTTQIATRLAEFIAFYNRMMFSWGDADITGYSGGGVTPHPVDIYAFSGAADSDVFADLDDMVTWMAALADGAASPYLNSQPITRYTTLINDWAAASAHPSGAITPQNMAAYSNNLGNALTDYEDWHDDLYDGVGSGDIAIADL